MGDVKVNCDATIDSKNKCVKLGAIYVVVSKVKSLEVFVIGRSSQSRLRQQNLFFLA